MRVFLVGALFLAVSVSGAWAQVPADDAATHYVPIEFQTVDHFKMSGHLALPKAGKPPFPVILLLMGSGPGNRYENIPGQVTADGKDSLLFKPIESELIQKGVAVMTYDKRGVQPTDNTFLHNSVDRTIYQTTTAGNLASDALTAFDLLLARPEIDVRRVGVLGHSEGTVLALKVAELRSAQVRALFMLGLFTRSMHEIFEYQGVVNSVRYFYGLDLNHDGYLEADEYGTAVAADPVLQTELGTWDELLKARDKTGDGRISEQEWRYFFEQQLREEDAAVADDTKPWPAEGPPRDWIRQYFAEGPYLERQLPFCTRLYLFQGEIDVQTPFEDALRLADACQTRQTPLGSFKSYREEGHAFSPRIGFKKIRDTIGPLDPTVAEDVAKEAARVL